jgi:hypothetical protein
MVKSCNPPRDEIPTNFLWRSAIKHLGFHQVRSGPIDKAHHDPVLMPRTLATTQRLWSWHIDVAAQKHLDVERRRPAPCQR